MCKVKTILELCHVKKYSSKEKFTTRLFVVSDRANMRKRNVKFYLKLLDLIDFYFCSVLPDGNLFYPTMMINIVLLITKEHNYSGNKISFFLWMLRIDITEINSSLTRIYILVIAFSIRRYYCIIIFISPSFHHHVKKFNLKVL